MLDTRPEETAIPVSRLTRQLYRVEARAQYEVHGDVKKISAIGKVLGWKISNPPTNPNRNSVEKKSTYNTFLPPEATGDEIVSRIRKLIRDDGPYIFEKLISYKNRDDKLNWSQNVSYLDGNWTTVGTWDGEGKTFKKTRLALAYVNPWPAPPRKKVRSRKLAPKYYTEWHVYAIAFVKENGKKIMLMWDSGLDANRDPKPAELQLFGTLKALWECEKPAEVYINTDIRYCLEARCLERAMQRLESWAKHGDRDFEGPDDPRIVGMRRLPTFPEYNAAKKIVKEAEAEKKLKEAAEKSKREEKGASKHPNKKQKLRG